MKVAELLEQIISQPETIEFSQVIDVIDENYIYTPTRFLNGKGEHLQVNEKGENEGSCKIFAFALLHNLAKEQTLSCFGDFYREEVLSDPGGNSHGNIRAFMISGWDGISFEGKALTTKLV